uniref:RIN4 pathogenic type III effector avirulence factor Avr cleavage site domain-containing protein n=1 Tax=Leersia perrieri TaxID=77586 RepID=A0A0D9XS33_9ORYZ
MAGKGGHIPKFGDWKSGDGGSPYTVFFEDARKRKNAGGVMPPPLARGDSVPPSGHRTPPHVGSGGTVPAWGQWNENNAGGGAQQYTLMFDQIRDERRGSAPSTPTIEQIQRATPNRYNHHSKHDNMPKRFTCFGLCLK